MVLISRELHWTRREILDLPAAEFDKLLELIIKGKKKT